MIRHSQKLLSLALITILSLAACGGTDLIRSFRAALAASGPLINSLIASGAIGETDANKIRQDFEDGVRCADSLYHAFKTVPKGSPNERSLKLNASVNGLKCFRQIAQRRNFEKHPKVKNAADIAEGVLHTLIVFYSDSGVMVARTDRSPTQAPKDEKELEKKLKEQIKQLEKALEP